jgi:PKD repeat protein
MSCAWRRAALAAAALVALAVAARAEGPAIDHSEIKCLVAGKYRKMPAKFSPGDVAQPRVYFRPEGVPSWYYVEMKPEAPLGHVGVLPKPTKKLVKKHIEYYVEAASKDFDTGRTPEYAPIVVEKDGECDRDLVPPIYSKNPPSAVFPSLPQGFALGGAAGIGTAAAVVGGGAAAAGGVILATRGDDPPQAVAATTTTTTTVVPVTSTTTLPPGRLALACQADVRQGPVPFTVKFNAQASGGTGVFDFLWDFGDGGTSTQVNPSHTFTIPGVYNVTVRATSGEVVDTCVRTVTALPVSADLDVRVVGAGSVSGPGIGCPGDCLETYPSGTLVTLTATPTGAASFFSEWTGDCAGETPTCVVTMDRARSVTARFQGAAATTHPLTVSFAGAGTGTVSGLACTAPCTATYNAGTPVTLNATATGGSTFVQWTGACTGGNPCTLVVTGPLTATAIFSAPPTFTLNVTTGGSGTGTVSGTGILCPTDCTETYPAGTPVTLTASAGTGSAFNGWTGDCVGSTGPACTLTMSANRTAGANFTLAVATLTLTVVNQPGSLAAIDVTPPGKFTCDGGPPPAGNACVLPYSPGATVLLTTIIETGAFLGWTGDCAGAPGACTLTMNGNRSATATFGVPLVGDPLRGRSATIASRLEAPGARLSATLNGVPLAPPAPGHAVWAIEPRPGDNRLEAALGGAATGTWRLELAGVPGLARGTVRVLQGEVVSVGPDAVVFRLKGRAGERFGLAFDVR